MGATTLIEELNPNPLPLYADGDVLRVGSTRVSLDSVIGAFQQGCSAEEIVLKFPTLELRDVYAVVTSYLRHREKVDTYLAERRHAADELRDEIHARGPQDGIRERLLARRTTASRLPA